MKKLFVLMMAALALGAGAAKAADRDTPEREGKVVALTAGEALDAGVLAGVWTNGLAYKASVSKSLTVVGRTESAAASGATAVIKRGTFLWANGGSSLADRDIGGTAYVWTNTAYTVGTAYSASYTNSAGKIMDVDSSGVWVRSGW